ncbi:hypothetical protein ACI3LY_001063 [Candidozyma auris]|uniref:Arrestin-like N-terminal domain-containing protein n=1 Tax=Candidozyma auris TaxID=498019 RepID=A0A8F3AIR5_CANAR|nr:hypothetical protein QG37_04361 [[Candida] auris]QWW25680.1 hypothetical protein CA7LBN_004567 [[Candida] auris]
MSNLRIELDHDKVYTTGDIVSGKVHLTVDEKVDLTSIEISLYGESRSRNRVHSGQLYMTKLEKHTLLELVSTVFPPPEIQSISSNDQYTLTEGEYTYPFAFTFPNKGHDADCKVEKRFFHSRGYTRRDDIKHVSLAPTYSYKWSFDEYCRVEYSVSVTVHNPSFFKFDTKVSEIIKFYPQNEDLTFSSKHLLDNGQLKPDFDSCTKDLKYLPDGTMKVEGFFTKLFSPSGMELPLELKVSFIGDEVDTPEGTTKRVVKSNDNLSNYIRLSLQTPISGRVLREVAGDDNVPKGESPRDSFKIRISGVKVRLLSRIRYLSVKTSRKTHKYDLLDKALDNEVSFCDFEPVAQEKCSSRLTKKELYGLDLDPEWFDCNIADKGQSFVTCNIKRDFHIEISVMVASTTDLSSEVKFRVECPINLKKGFVSSELDNDTGKASFGYGVAPPEYGDEKNSEPMEWGV